MDWTFGDVLQRSRKNVCSRGSVAYWFLPRSIFNFLFLFFVVVKLAGRREKTATGWKNNNWLFAKPVKVSSFKGTTSYPKACFVKEGFSVANRRDQSAVSVRPSRTPGGREASHRRAIWALSCPVYIYQWESCSFFFFSFFPTVFHSVPECIARTSLCVI